MIRSFLFACAFYAVTLIMCVLYLPTLLLPRKIHVKITDTWVRVVAFLEDDILNLKYRIEGQENIPKSGAFIVAAKHQSVYETFKLRLILNNPTIVLKKELLNIPIWGWYLSKYGVIAIDRSTPDKALRSLQKGAVEMAAQNRPIVIFPQGTRVRPGVTPAEKPYKPGVARVQDVTKLPIIPLALNTGAFWPKGAWIKRPGTVTFKFLKPIPPGLDRTTLMKELEMTIENESNELIARARTLKHTKPPALRGAVILMFLMLAGFAAYTAWWGVVARRVQNEDMALNPFRMVAIENPAKPSGYPFMNLTRAEERFGTENENITLKNISVSALPLPKAEIDIKTGEIYVTSYKWLSPILFDSFKAKISPGIDGFTIESSELKYDEFIAFAVGSVDTSQRPPAVSMKVSFKNYGEFLNNLVKKGVIDDRTALFMTAGFNALADESGLATTTITQNGRTLYAGPFAIAELPEGLE
jgi:1-acyl-sn-glycerol-3-phosphate acyltransferase